MTAIVTLNKPGGGHEGIDIVARVPALGADQAAATALASVSSRAGGTPATSGSGGTPRILVVGRVVAIFIDGWDIFVV